MSAYPPQNAKHTYQEQFSGSTLVTWTPIQGGSGGWIGAVVDADNLIAYESAPQDSYGKAQGVAKRWHKRRQK